MGDFPTRILLATDGSEGAELAASRAVDLARRTESELHLVHVGYAPVFLKGEPGTRGYERMLLEEIEDEARELLRKLSWRVKEIGGDVAGAHLGMGEVDLEIVGLAKKLGADLIVMGCRGRRGIRRAVGRSVSAAVVRRAPCPVLVVPSNEMAETPERAALLQGSR
jgi:nucleotide-binding universal stress UspA family protein